MNILADVCICNTQMNIWELITQMKNYDITNILFSLYTLSEPQFPSLSPFTQEIINIQKFFLLFLL